MAVITALGVAYVRRSFKRHQPGRVLFVLLSALTLILPLSACSSGSKKSAAQDLNAPTPMTIVDANSQGVLTSNKHLSGTVFLDPGHGGVDSGTSGYTNDGTLVDEKTVVLQIALKVAAQLRADGLAVVMSRTTDDDPCINPSDLSADGQTIVVGGVLNDLQCRIDKANASNAKILLSLHMNAYSDPSVSGTETFYDTARPFSSKNQQFAQLVQQNLMNALHAQGYTTPNRGISADGDVGGESMGTLPDSYNHLVMLGPGVPGELTPSSMPGALSEIFFLSNPSEATAVTEPSVQNVIAGALTNAIETFLTQGG
ncbi:MAG: N-acetylmuramoyl-L-alanine amidase [Nitrolancea sp.]